MFLKEDANNLDELLFKENERNTVLLIKMYDPEL